MVFVDVVGIVGGVDESFPSWDGDGEAADGEATADPQHYVGAA
jgi:hypothetical protein